MATSTGRGNWPFFSDWLQRPGLAAVTWNRQTAAADGPDQLIWSDWFFEAADQGGVTGTGAATLAGVTAAGTAEVTAAPVTGAGAATLAGVAAAGTATVTVSAAGAATLAGVTASGTGQVAIGAVGAATLAGITASGAGLVSVAASGAATLQGATAAGTGLIAVSGVGAATLADLAASGLAVTAVGVATVSGGTPPEEAPIEVTAEFSGTSVRGSHINSMAWLASAGERRPHLRSIFRAHRLQREEDEIRRMQKRAKRRPIDRQPK